MLTLSVLRRAAAWLVTCSLDSLQIRALGDKSLKEARIDRGPWDDIEVICVPGTMSEEREKAWEPIPKTRLHERNLTHLSCGGLSRSGHSLSGLDPILGESPFRESPMLLSPSLLSPILLSPVLLSPILQSPQQSMSPPPKHTVPCPSTNQEQGLSRVRAVGRAWHPHRRLYDQSS